MLFTTSRSNRIEDLCYDDFLILLQADASLMQIVDLEARHDAMFICSANGSLTQAGKLFSNDVEGEVANNPDLVRLFSRSREELIAQISDCWADVVLDGLAIS